MGTPGWRWRSWRGRLAGLGYSADPGLHINLAEVKVRTVAAYRKTLGPYENFADDLRAAMPRDAVFVRDATVAANTWGTG